AHDGDELARLDREVHPAQRTHLDLTHPVGLGDAGDFDDLRHRGLASLMRKAQRGGLRPHAGAGLVNHHAIAFTQVAAQHLDVDPVVEPGADRDWDQPSAVELPYACSVADWLGRADRSAARRLMAGAGRILAVGSAAVDERETGRAGRGSLGATWRKAQRLDRQT